MTHLRSFAGVLAVAGAAGLNLFVGEPAAADPPDDLVLGQEPDLPAVSISTPEVIEGTGGVNELVFLLELDKPAVGGESVRFFTQDAQGSADPIYDDEPVLETYVFGAGETSLAAPVPIVTDSVPEANKHVLVQMDTSSGLTIADDVSTGVILDDDAPSISVDDVTLAESSGGPTGFHFTVSLTEPSTVDVFVTATPTAGTAEEGTDWQAFAQLVQFAPGETTHDVLVSVVGDEEPEDDETFTVELSDAAYGVVEDSSGLGTILDDDSDDGDSGSGSGSDAGDDNSGDDGTPSGDGRDGEPSGRDDPGREPGRSTGTDSDPGSYTAGERRTSPTTTALPTTELETNLASSDEPQGFDLRPVVAVAVAFGAIRLLRGWHLRRQT